jgi:hypothetical protein
LAALVGAGAHVGARDYVTPARADGTVHRPLPLDPASGIGPGAHQGAGRRDPRRILEPAVSP